MAKVKSLVSTADEAKHEALRNSVAKALTQSATLKQETPLNQAISELIETLGRHQKVDISQMLFFYSIDVDSRLLFSEPLGCLRTKSFLEDILPNLFRITSLISDGCFLFRDSKDLCTEIHCDQDKENTVEHGSKCRLQIAGWHAED